MKFIPRSHLRGDLDMDSSKLVLGTAMSDDVLEQVGLSADDAIELLLEPGDLALWSPYLVHGSGTNRSDHKRRLYINGYVRADDCDRGEWAFRQGGRFRSDHDRRWFITKSCTNGPVRITSTIELGGSTGGCPLVQPPLGAGAMRLSDFNALSFDCYGTLIDWETGIAEALRPLSERSGVSADRLLEAYGPVEHAIEIEQPGLLYSRLLERVHERLSRAVRRRPGRPCRREVRARRSATGRRFPTAPRRSRYLKQHFKLIILSNVDRQSFAASNRRLGVEFDAHLHRPGYRLLQARSSQFRISGRGAGTRRHCQGPAPPRRAEPVSRPCPGEPDQVLHRRGSTAARARTGRERRSCPIRCRITISALRRWRNWPPLIVPSWASPLASSLSS